MRGESGKKKTATKKTTTAKKAGPGRKAKTEVDVKVKT